MKIAYADEQVQAEIEVGVATLRRSIERDRLMFAAEASPDPDPLVQFYARDVYPSLIAASPAGTLTVGGEALPWPPSFAQVLELPHALVQLTWWPAVVRLNPFFEIRASGPAEDAHEQEKKATSGSTG
jgi:hypothetical protein